MLSLTSEFNSRSIEPKSPQDTVWRSSAKHTEIIFKNQIRLKSIELDGSICNKIHH